MSAVAARVLPLFPDPFTAARNRFEELPIFLLSSEVQQMSHSEVERELERRGREVMRQMYQGWLDHLAPGQTLEPVVDAEGNERTTQRSQSRELATVFGDVTVRRTGYGAEGQESLHPLDARLNLPEERYSHELRRRAAEEAAKGSFDEAVAAIACHTGTQVPKRQVEELVCRAAQDFDAFYEDRQATCASIHESSEPVLVITADAKGVVMHREDLRPETRAAAEKDRVTLRTRVTRAERGNRKRMAAVAAVYTVAPYVRTPRQVYLALAREPGDADSTTAAMPLPRPHPQKKRVWASLEREPAHVLAEAIREAESRDPDRTKTWVAVVDGNEHYLDLLEELAARHGARLTIVLDLFHVLQYVWEAGRALEGNDDERVDPWVLERMLWILEGRGALAAAAMRRSATRRDLTPQQREPVDRCADYLLKYRDYMEYHDYLAEGLPIASGVIEGACRHLVKDRMGITGARWRLKGAEAVLRLRALRSSGDFEEYWRFHEAREQDRNHRAKYVGDQLPQLDATRDLPPRPGA